MDKMNFLRDVRMNEERRPSLVEKTALELYGERELYEGSTSLKNEILAMREQVLIAALDTGNMKLAKSLLLQLRKQFRVSARVDRLEGLYEECSLRFDEAGKIYDSMLEKNPSNTIASKRKIAMLKARGKNAEAIVALNTYLKENMGDDECWRELCNLYLASARYQTAAFCLEEMILAQPLSYNIQMLYAECMFTLGRSEDILIARKYFANSVAIKKENNPRGLWGLAASCYALASWHLDDISKKTGAPKGKESSKTKDSLTVSGTSEPFNNVLNKDTGFFAIQKLEQLYEKKSAPKEIQKIVAAVAKKMRDTLEDSGWTTFVE